VEAVPLAFASSRASPYTLSRILECPSSSRRTMKGNAVVVIGSAGTRSVATTAPFRFPGREVNYHELCYGASRLFRRPESAAAHGRSRTPRRAGE
jgi:hypothetical protein